MIKPAPFRSMLSFPRLLAILAAPAAFARGEEFLPLPTSLSPGGVAGTPAMVPTGFIKPSKSIKPPSAAPQLIAVNTPVPATVQIVSSPAPDTRLRRLVVVDATMSPDAIRDFIIASSQGRTPVTVAGGVTASAPVLSDLAALFGSNADAATQQKVLDKVKAGMGSSTKSLKRVEVVGWVPSQGVMAVAVYPES